MQVTAQDAGGQVLDLFLRRTETNLNDLKQRSV